jgi:hypothetical protein
MGAVMDLFKVLYEPGAVFERIREKPKFLAPFLGLAVLLAVCILLLMPYQQAAMASKMAEIAQANPAAAAGMQKYAFVGVIVGPIIFAIILVISATILWVVASIFGGEGKWGTLLSISTYASITGILLQFVTVLVLMVKGVGQVSSPEDLKAPLGLNLLDPGATGFMGAFLGGINLFAVWGVILTAIGIQVTHKTAKGTAYTIAIVSTLVLLLIASGLASLAPR